MVKMTDILNGDTITYSKEVHEALMTLLSTIALKVEDIDVRLKKLEDLKNE